MAVQDAGVMKLCQVSSHLAGRAPGGGGGGFGVQGHRNARLGTDLGPEAHVDSRAGQQAALILNLKPRTASQQQQQRGAGKQPTRFSSLLLSPSTPAHTHPPCTQWPSPPEQSGSAPDPT